MVSWMSFYKVKHILNFLYEYSISSLLSSKIYWIYAFWPSIVTLVKCHKYRFSFRICKLKLYFIISPYEFCFSRFSRSIRVNQIRIKCYREVVWIKFSSKCREVFCSITVQLSPLIVYHIYTISVVCIENFVNVWIYWESLIIFPNKIFCIINCVCKRSVESSVCLLYVFCIIC